MLASMLGNGQTHSVWVGMSWYSLWGVVGLNLGICSDHIKYLKKRDIAGSIVSV